MRSLGRPNRDQIVSTRPNDLTTLEAIDLSNGATLAALLDQGAKSLAAKSWPTTSAFVEWLYQASLSRAPTPAEQRAAEEIIGPTLGTSGIADLTWSVLMLPEFQLIR